MILKEFIPPILSRWLKRALKLEDNKEYKNYSQAIEACTSDAYLNVELCNMIADKTVGHERKLNEKHFCWKSQLRDHRRFAPFAVCIVRGR